MQAFKSRHIKSVGRIYSMPGPTGLKTTGHILAVCREDKWQDM